MLSIQFDADVIGCVRDPITGNVTAIDTYNQANIRNNIADAATQDLILFNSSFINGTISCTYVLNNKLVILVYLLIFLFLDLQGQ